VIWSFPRLTKQRIDATKLKATMNTPTKEPSRRTRRHS
jgi:hypothetical protein